MDVELKDISKLILLHKHSKIKKFTLFKKLAKYCNIILFQTLKFPNFFLVKYFFLYTCMQNPRLRTVYRQRKWPLLAPVRKIMALGRKKIALGCKIIALG